jgi:hypothetical protein
MVEPQTLILELPRARGGRGGCGGLGVGGSEGGAERVVGKGEGKKGETQKG